MKINKINRVAAKQATLSKMNSKFFETGRSFWTSKSEKNPR
jgi:hypothetical protein